MASTHFSPVDARRAFPCWDEPRFKATFNISLARLPNMTSLSNSELAYSDPRWVIDHVIYTCLLLHRSCNPYLCFYIDHVIQTYVLLHRSYDPHLCFITSFMWFIPGFCYIDHASRACDLLHRSCDPYLCLVILFTCITSTCMVLNQLYLDLYYSKVILLVFCCNVHVISVLFFYVLCLTSTFFYCHFSSDGWIIDHFQTTPPISTYLIAFVVIDFPHKEHIGINGRKVKD